MNPSQPYTPPGFRPLDPSAAHQSELARLWHLFWNLPQEVLDGLPNSAAIHVLNTAWHIFLCCMLAAWVAAIGIYLQNRFASSRWYGFWDKAKPRIVKTAALVLVAYILLRLLTTPSSTLTAVVVLAGVGLILFLVSAQRSAPPRHSAAKTLQITDKHKPPRWAVGLKRAVVVLTVVWALYVLVGFRLQQVHEAQVRMNSYVQVCFPIDADNSHRSLQKCLDEGVRQYQSELDEWSVKKFYLPYWWALLLTIAVPPVLLYWSTRGLVAVGAWVWRGFRV
jgi:hypothetical protein